MTRLRQELEKDPDATFEFEGVLPSGNIMRGTVGPVINRKLCASIAFERDPPTEEDKRFAVEAMNKLLGEDAVFVGEATSSKEHERLMRSIFGGGKG